MLKEICVAVLASGVLLAAGCRPAPPPPTVHASMTQVIAPQAKTIWDVTNRATNDAGDGLDASKISAADWIELGKAGRQLGDRARLLAETGPVTVAAPGVKLQDEGSSGGADAKKIQAFIDADRAAFAEHARKLAEVGDTVTKAAETKSAAPLFAVAGGLDQVCESCHLKFWYPPGATPAR